jgi:CarD family transcriptional regulator
MFALYQKVVYPGHGVAQINSIIEMVIGGQKSSYYEMTFLNRDITVRVRTDKTESVGIRPLSSGDSIADVFRIISEPARKTTNYEFNASNWNKRNKDYHLKIRNGNLKDLSEVYRDLRFIETQKELSFGEKDLLDRTETLLVEEISLVQKLEQKQTEDHLRSLCCVPAKRMMASESRQ